MAGFEVMMQNMMLVDSLSMFLAFVLPFTFVTGVVYLVLKKREIFDNHENEKLIQGAASILTGILLGLFISRILLLSPAYRQITTSIIYPFVQIL